MTHHVIKKWNPVNLAPEPFLLLKGAYDILDYQGRKGMVLHSRHGSLRLPGNPCEREEGAIGLWILPLEDLSPWPHWEHHKTHNENVQSLTLLADQPVLMNDQPSGFAMVWHSNWHPGFFTKFFRGWHYDGFRGEPKAIAAAGHLPLKAGSWVHLLVTWSRPQSRIRLYCDGIRVGHSDAQLDARKSTDTRHLTFDRQGPDLYTGGTLWATGEITAYEEFLDDGSADDLYLSEASTPASEHRNHLRSVFRASETVPMPPAQENHWHPVLDLPLTDAKGLDRFFIQGCGPAPRLTEEGLRVTTDMNDPTPKRQPVSYEYAYLWLRGFWHGDMRIRYQFKTKQRGGLSLLMAQVSGMHGEDHLADYPLDVDGRMELVCWKDIRNYHWEYYREMDDVRNEAASHAMLKNPFFTPLGYRVQTELYPLDEWIDLEWRQERDRILGAINGRVILDTVDDPHTHNGPRYSRGRACIRCMCRTDMVFRNLKIDIAPRFGQPVSGRGV